MPQKKIRHPAVIGQSLVDDRIYIDSEQYNEALRFMFADKKIVLSKKFRFFPYTKLKSDLGLCSAPYGYHTARHCVCSLCENGCENKTVELFNDETTKATVIACSRQRPWWDRLICFILSLFGYTDVRKCSVLDWCLLNKSNPLGDYTLLGVLSAGTIDGSIAIFSPFSINIERDRMLIGTEVESISYDFQENRVVHWRGVIEDVIMAFVPTEQCVTQIYGYVVKPLDGTVIKPGYSGSPLLVRTLVRTR